jgi:hypothetical protein
MDNILKVLEEICCGDMNWIELGQDRDQWEALMMIVMKFHVHNDNELLDHLRNFCWSGGKKALGRQKHRWRIILQWIFEI